MKTSQKWNKVKLSELGSVDRGRSRHRPRNDASLYGGAYPFVQTGDIKSANFYVNSYSQTYNEKGLAQSKIWDPGTLCITIAANIGESAILKVPSCFPDSIVGFQSYKNVSDVRFVKYLLDLTKNQFQTISKGTTQDNLSLEKLLSIDLAVPDFSAQKQIADVLSAYDDLIENNNRRIKILEETAQKIYKEWFVNFRFPGHEKVKIAKNGLPEGWGIQPIRDIFSVQYGKNLSTAKISSSGTYPVYGAGGVIGFYDEKNIECKTALVTSRGNGSGTVWRTKGAGFVTNNSFTIAGNNKFSHLNFSSICNILLNANIMGAKSGSAQPQITITNLDFIEVLVAPQKITEEYQAQAVSLYEMSDDLFAMNENLKKSRDLLIPQLVSGKLEIK